MPLTQANLRSGYFLLAEFCPDAYLSIISTELAAGGTSDKVDLFSRFYGLRIGVRQLSNRVDDISRRVAKALLPTKVMR
jgi:hypothetical protein